jgi:hypothetical protein
MALNGVSGIVGQASVVTEAARQYMRNSRPQMCRRTFRAILSMPCLLRGCSTIRDCIAHPRSRVIENKHPDRYRSIPVFRVNAHIEARSLQKGVRIFNAGYLVVLNDPPATSS